MTTTLDSKGARAHTFDLRSTRRGQHLTILVRGELDENSAHHLDEMLAHMTRPNDEILLDVSEVELMDKAGLEALLRSNGHAESVGAQITLAGLSYRLQQLLDRCDLSSASHFLDEIENSDLVGHGRPGGPK